MANEQHNIKITTEVDSASGQSAVSALDQKFNELTDTIAANAAEAKANALAQEEAAAAQAAQQAVLRATQQANSEASRNLREGLQGIAGVAGVIDPSLGRAVSLMNQLKLAEEGVTGSALNVQSALSAIGSTFSNPSLLIGLGVLGTIAITLSKIAELTAENTAAQEKYIETLKKTAAAEAELRPIAEENQRQQATAAAKALDEAGVLGRGGEDPQEQTRRVLLAAAAAQRQSATDDSATALRAVVTAEQFGKGSDQAFINELLNILIYFKGLATQGGKELEPFQAAGVVGTSIGAEANRRAGIRRQSQLSEAGFEGAAPAEAAGGLTGQQGAEFDKLLQDQEKARKEVIDAEQAVEDARGNFVIRNIFGRTGAQQREFDNARFILEAAQERLSKINEQIGSVQVSGQIIVMPGGSATIYNDPDRFRPGPTGYTEAPFRAGSD